MVVKINGRVLDAQSQKEVKAKVKQESFTWKTVKHNVENDRVKAKPEAKIETLRERIAVIREKIKRNFMPLVSGVNLLAAAPVSLMASQYGITGQIALQTVPLTQMSFPVVQAAVPAGVNMGMGSALMPVISMLQQLALPVGIGMAIWGMIEIMIGNPGGRTKIIGSVLGYIGCFVVPYFYFQIGHAFSSIPYPGGI